VPAFAVARAAKSGLPIVFALPGPERLHLELGTVVDEIERTNEMLEAAVVADDALLIEEVALKSNETPLERLRLIPTFREVNRLVAPGDPRHVDTDALLCTRPMHPVHAPGRVNMVENACKSLEARETADGSAGRQNPRSRPVNIDDL
jgi:hypothetical protein